MKVIPTTPTWLTLEDYYAIFKPSREPTEDLYLIFEKEFAQYLGRKHAVLTSSGTAGIYLALKAFGFPPGTEVITPAFTCIRVPNAIVACGLVPRFVDVDDSANMDINAVEGVLNPRTRFLLLTHMYGNPANIDPLSSLAN